MPRFPDLFPRSFRLFLALILFAVPTLPVPALADRVNPAGTTISGQNSGMETTADNERLLNLGEINVNAAYGHAVGLGPAPLSNPFNGLRLENGGTVSVTADGGDALGLWGNDFSSLINSGALTVTSTGGEVFGLLGNDFSSLVNSGALTVTSTVDGATGLSGYDNSSLVNSGTLTATGFWAIGMYGNDYSSLVNSGSLTATATDDDAIGVSAASNTSLVNSGMLTVTSTATGFNAYGLSQDSGTASNYGLIRLSAPGGLAHELNVIGPSGAVLLGDWALDLRDFSDQNTRPFAATGGGSSGAALDFTGGRLILRPGLVGAGFAWGREYALADMLASGSRANGALAGALAEMPWLRAGLNGADWSDQRVSLHVNFTRKTNPGQAVAAQGVSLAGSQMRALGAALAAQMSGGSFGSSGQAGGQAQAAQAPVLLASNAPFPPAQSGSAQSGSAQPGPDSGWSAFLTPFYSRADNHKLDAESESIGFMAGASREFTSRLAGGFHLGLSTSDLSGDLLTQDGEAFSGLAGLHGLYRFTPALYLRGQLTGYLARSSYDWQGGLAQYPYFADADVDSHGLYASLDAGYDWRINAANSLTPELGLSWLWLHQDAYTMNWRDGFGNAASHYDLRYRDQDFNAVYGTARLRWRGEYPMGKSGGRLAPTLALGLRQTLGNGDLKSRLRYLGSNYSTKVSEDDSTALVEAGLDWREGRLSFGLAYTGEFGSDQQVNTGWVNMKLEF